MFVQLRGRVLHDRVQVVLRPLASVRAALEKIAAAAPHALAGLVDEQWGRRYGRPARLGRLGRNPTRPKTSITHAGEDAFQLLARLLRPRR